jgi:hypothetical protein
MNPEIKDKTNAFAAPSKVRLLFGGGIFILGLFSPILISLVTASALPAGLKAAISGLLVFGLPELFMLIAAAILGKTGFIYLKSRLYGLFKRYVAPPDTVSPVRYRIGLVMFCTPLIFAFIDPYAGHLIPGREAHTKLFAFGGDLLLLTSLFILGGDFWDKLRSLFVHGAKVEFPGSIESKNNNSSP